MSQVKITSFFARKSGHPIKPSSIETILPKCDSSSQSNPDYDSDSTDIYDYETDISAPSTLVTRNDNIDEKEDQDDQELPVLPDVDEKEIDEKEDKDDQKLPVVPDADEKKIDEKEDKDDQELTVLPDVDVKEIDNEQVTEKTDEPIIVKRKPGRPRKKPLPELNNDIILEVETKDNNQEKKKKKPPVTIIDNKKPGRPSKTTQKKQMSEVNNENVDSSNDSQESAKADDNGSLRRSSRQRVKPVHLLESESDEKQDDFKKPTRSSKHKRKKVDITSFFHKDSKGKKIEKTPLKSDDSVILISEESPEVRPKYIAEPVPIQEFLKQWTQTYEPKSVIDLIGHSNEIDQFKQWLSTWHATFNKANDSDSESDSDSENVDQENVNGKCFFIHGPNGVGKTSLVYSIAQDHGFKVLEYNATSQRLTPSLIQKELGESLQSYYINQVSVSSFFGAKPSKPSEEKAKKSKRQKKNVPASARDSNVKLSKSLILIDDLDGIIYENRSFIELWRALRQIIADARKPIVFTSSLEHHFLCADPQYFCTIKLNPIGRSSLVRHLNNICQKESLEHLDLNSPYSTISDIQDLGDARKALNHAQFWLSGSTEQPQLQSKQNDTEAEFAADSFAKQAQLMDFISLEDIYQKEFDQVLAATIEWDHPCDRHVHDNRQFSFQMSTSEPTTGLQRNLSLLSKEVSTIQAPTGTEVEEMEDKQNLIRDHYTKLDCQSRAQFADSLALIDTLSQMYPNLVADVRQRKETEDPITAPARRKGRVTKASLFDFLN